MRKTFIEKCINVHLCRFAMALLFLLPAISNLRANPFQDNKAVSGVVISASDNQPLIGVSVFVKGTTIGTMTDIDGKYSLDMKSGSTLVFTYIGYLKQEISVSGKKVINVTMKEDAQALEEVVVIGYGVQKKKLSTGATLQVKGDELAKMNTTSPLQALQGKTPGVTISSTSGQPGKGMKVTVRGLGTVNNASPLYVVDGIQTGDITYLNNSDIESIDVLKDAASAAIYGSQSANGVVLITTKTGKKGNAKVSLDAYYGTQQASRKLSMLNASEYKLIMDEQAVNEKKLPFDWSSYNLGNTDTDWVNKMLVDDAVTQNYILGVQGGGESSVYSLSLSYTGQEGVVGGSEVSNYRRYGFRVNTEHKLYKDVLKVGQHMTFAFTNTRGIADGNQYGNSLRGAFGMSPFVPVYDSKGNYWDNSESLWNNQEGNPYGSMMLGNQSRKNNQKLIGDVYAELQIIKNLKFKTTFGFDFYSDDDRSYTPTYKFSVGDTQHSVTKVSQSMNKGYAYSIDNVLSYHFDINQHSIDAMVGQSARKYQGQGLWGNNTDLRTPGYQYAWLNNAENSSVTKSMYGGAPQVETSLVSYFGRLGYNYKETYMINATVRSDGSSRFAQGKRWGVFPSVSTGWTISNENFMKGAKTWLDFLKIRASWGQVGNQNIGDYKYLSLIKTDNAVYNFGTQEGTAYDQIGYYPSTLGNPDLKWETSEQLNFGFDALLFRNRLAVNVDWYNKTTKDWLVSVPVLATTGLSTKTINGGDVKNTGLEVALNWNDNVGGLKYSLGGNIAYNKNEVGNIPTGDGIIHGKSNILYANSTEFYRAENGHAIGYFWGWKTDGIFQNEAEVQSYKNSKGIVIQPNAVPGDVRYVDIDGNGAIGNSDKVDLGHPTPDYTFGLNLSLEYKNFDFSVNANGVAGNKIVQSYRNVVDSKQNYTKAILSRWHGEGTSNTMPRVTETNVNWQFSDLYIQNGDFLRISNITLGYDFSKLINCKYISQFRLYGQVQNAFTFTKYDGMDPEVGWGDDDFGSGIDVGLYPRSKSYLVGLNIKF